MHLQAKQDALDSLYDLGEHLLDLDPDTITEGQVAEVESLRYEKIIRKNLLTSFGGRAFLYFLFVLILLLFHRPLPSFPTSVRHTVQHLQVLLTFFLSSRDDYRKQVKCLSKDLLGHEVLLINSIEVNKTLDAI